MISSILLLSAVMSSGVAYSYETLYNGTAVITSVSVPQGITEVYIPGSIDGYTVSGIESYVFAGQIAVEKIVIPDTVTYIGDASFMSCTTLREAVVGAGVKALPDDCFFACPALESVTLPENLESIGNETFFGCNALNLYVPASVYSIGENAFGMNTDPHSNETVNIYGFLVKGVKGSFAETYSVNNNIDFIDMNNYISGDFNNDGYVDANDASAVLEGYAQLSTGSAYSFTKKQLIMGDVNSDGVIDANDASAVLGIYAQLSTNI